MFNDSVVLSPAEIRRQSTTAACPVGTRGVTGDGRTYFYAKAGEAITQGSLLVPQQAITQANNSTINKLAAEITSTHASIWINTTAGVTEAYGKDVFKGGMLFVKNFHSDTDLSGGGQAVRIKGNDALAISDATGFRVYLDDDERFVKSVTSTAKIGLMPNSYMNVYEWDGGATALSPIGVANRDITTLYYFWAQTWGPCAVQSDANTLGRVVIASTVTDSTALTHQVGQGTIATDSVLSNAQTIWSGKNINTPQIGYAMTTVGTALDFGLVFLTLAP